jgi:hypothetical protein
MDLGSFYARRPRLGTLYRYLGYAACLLALAWNDRPELISQLLIVVLIAWGMAWYRIVGAAWRAPLVAAALLCAVILTKAHGCPFAVCCHGAAQ